MNAYHPDQQEKFKTSSKATKVAVKKGRKKKPKKWRKPEGMPKRPLSAYNIFFAEERQKLLEMRQKGSGIGFANLARTVAAKWKGLSKTEKEPFAQSAAKEQDKYKSAVEEWQNLGLDPRKKKQSVKKSTTKKKATKMDIEDSPIRMSRIRSAHSKSPSSSMQLDFCATTVTGTSTAQSLQAATEIAESTFGLFNEIGEEVALDELDDKPSSDFLNPIPIEDFFSFDDIEGSFFDEKERVDDVRDQKQFNQGQYGQQDPMAQPSNMGDIDLKPLPLMPTNLELVNQQKFGDIHEQKVTNDLGMSPTKVFHNFVHRFDNNAPRFHRNSFVARSG